MMRSILAPFLSLVLLLWAQADPIDEFVKAEMQKQGIPGLSLAVIKEGRIVKAQGYGVADIKLQTPVTPDTVFKIGSVSKQFIATGIMLVAKEGRLGLGDPIAKYLQGAPAAWNGITIRHLLTHTSGLVREAPGFDPFKIQADIDVIKSAYTVPLRFSPGEKWEYSNLGYFALGEIITVASGRPWSEYLRDKVFAPSGMAATRTTTTTERVPNLSRGYTDNEKPRVAPDWPAVRPSGAFLSTVLDLAKWDGLLYTDTILDDATRRQMWTAVTLNDGSSHPYGFGWRVGSLHGRKAVHHGGGMPGFQAQFIRFLDDRLTIALVINSDDADDDSLALGVAARYLPAAVPAGVR